MISFSCSETEKVFHRKTSRWFGNIQRVALGRLIALDSARNLSDLAGQGCRLKPSRVTAKASTRFASAVSSASALHGLAEMQPMLRSSIIVKRGNG
jgi:hypothetical protein